MTLRGTSQRFRSIFIRESAAHPRIRAAACEALEERQLLAWTLDVPVAMGQFDYDQFPQRFTFDVNGDPAGPITVDDVEVWNLTTASKRADDGLQVDYDPATTIAEVSFADPADGSPLTMPNGNYQAFLNFENVLDTSGQTVGDVDALFTDFFLQGDLNRDRVVDLADVAVLERNFGAVDPTLTWSDGDLDGDGDVDLTDSAKQQRNFSVTIHEPPASSTGKLSVTTQSDSAITVTRFNRPRVVGGDAPPPDEWRIYRSIDGVEYEEIASIPGTTNSYTDTDLTDGTKYWYRMRPWTAAAGLGHTSSERSSVTVLPAPTKVTAHKVRDDRVRIAWKNNASTHGTFRIERAIGSGDFVEIAEAARYDSSIFLDDAGVDGTYRYRVTVVNGVNFSAPSTSADVDVATYDDGVTSSAVPVADINLVAEPGQPGHIDLSWTTENIEGVEHMILQRYIDGEASWSDLSILHYTQTAYIDSEVNSPEDHTYRLMTFNDHGEGETSNIAIAWAESPSPSTPTNISVEADVFNRDYLISWDSGDAWVAGYDIWRAHQPNSTSYWIREKVATVPASENSYNIRSIHPGNLRFDTIRFEVETISYEGKRSEPALTQTFAAEPPVVDNRWRPGTTGSQSAGNGHNTNNRASDFILYPGRLNSYSPFGFIVDFKVSLRAYNFVGGNNQLYRSHFSDLYQITISDASNSESIDLARGTYENLAEIHNVTDGGISYTANLLLDLEHVYSGDVVFDVTFDYETMISRMAAIAGNGHSAYSTYLPWETYEEQFSEWDHDLQNPYAPITMSDFYAFKPRFMVSGAGYANSVAMYPGERSTFTIYAEGRGDGQYYSSTSRDGWYIDVNLGGGASYLVDDLPVTVSVPVEPVDVVGSMTLYSGRLDIEVDVPDADLGFEMDSLIFAYTDHHSHFNLFYPNGSLHNSPILYPHYLAHVEDHAFRSVTEPVEIVAHRTGSRFGERVSRHETLSIIVNDDVDEPEPMSWGGMVDNENDKALMTAGSLRPRDDDLMRVTLRALGDKPDDGTLALELSNPNAVRIFDANGIEISDFTHDIETDSGGTGWADNIWGYTDTDIWIEGLQADPDFSLSFVHRDGDGATVSVDAVNVAVMDRVKLRLDGNRDGQITFDEVDMDVYRFWVNDDSDIVRENDDEDGNPRHEVDAQRGDDDFSPNILESVISVRSDLHDYSILKVRVPRSLLQANDGTTMFVRLENGGLQSAISLTQVPPDFADRMYTDIDVAGEVGEQDERGTAKRTIKKGPWFESGKSVVIENQRPFAGNNASLASLIESRELFTSSSPVSPSFDEDVWYEDVGDNVVLTFLLEGVYTGETVIAIGTTDVTGDEVVHDRTPLELLYAEEFVEHWSVDPETEGDTWYNEDDLWHPLLRAELRDRSIDLGQKGRVTTDSLDYMLFVHGWRMKPEERMSFAVSSMKKLFWQGFDGKVGLYEWPTGWADNGGLALESFWNYINAPGVGGNYRLSEQNAYLSGAGLHHLLTQLSSEYGGENVNVFSHSMGGVVLSEALRLEAYSANPDPIVNVAVLSQSATVAGAYQTGLPSDLFDEASEGNPVTPDIYSLFPVGPGANRAYFEDIDVAASAVVNFFASQDYAVGFPWRVNQRNKPDDFGPNGRSYIFDNGDFKYLDLLDGIPYAFDIAVPVQRYEVFAFAAEGRTSALGHIGGTAGPFADVQGVVRGFDISEGGVDVPAGYGASSKQWDHSWQFIESAAATDIYWNEMLIRASANRWGDWQGRH